jgi:hypothetical protein
MKSLGSRHHGVVGLRRSGDPAKSANRPDRGLRRAELGGEPLVPA